jgi:hypothetical protein
MIAGVVVITTARLRNIMWLGWFVCACGFGVMTLMSRNSSAFVVYFPPALASVGSGMLFMPLLLAIQSVQTDDDVGVATSTEVFVRNLGLTVAVAVATVIFENRFDRAVESLVKGDIVPGLVQISGRQAAGAWDVVRKLPEVQRHAYQSVYSSGLRWTWSFMVGAIVAGLVASLFVGDVRLDNRDSRDTERVCEVSEADVVPS